MTSRVREDAPEVGEGTVERPGLGETEGDRPGRGGREGEEGGMDEMMYDSVGAVTAMEREGKEDLLHACMAQAEYDKKGTLQDWLWLSMTRKGRCRIDCGLVWQERDAAGLTVA